MPCSRPPIAPPRALAMPHLPLPIPRASALAAATLRSLARTPMPRLCRRHRASPPPAPCSHLPTAPPTTPVPPPCPCHCPSAWPHVATRRSPARRPTPRPYPRRRRPRPPAPCCHPPRAPPNARRTCQLPPPPAFLL